MEGRVSVDKDTTMTWPVNERDVRAPSLVVDMCLRTERAKRVEIALPPWVGVTGERPPPLQRFATGSTRCDPQCDTSVIPVRYPVRYPVRNRFSKLFPRVRVFNIEIYGFLYFRSTALFLILFYKGYRTGYRTGYPTGIALVSHWEAHWVMPSA